MPRTTIVKRTYLLRTPWLQSRISASKSSNRSIRNSSFLILMRTYQAKRSNWRIIYKLVTVFRVIDNHFIIWLKQTKKTSQKNMLKFLRIYSEKKDFNKSWNPEFVTLWKQWTHNNQISPNSPHKNQLKNNFMSKTKSIQKSFLRNHLTLQGASAVPKVTYFLHLPVPALKIHVFPQTARTNSIRSTSVLSAPANNNRSIIPPRKLYFRPRRKKSNLSILPFSL